MYRAQVKPWQSAGWRPHLSEEAHRYAVKDHDSVEKEKAETPTE